MLGLFVAMGGAMMAFAAPRATALLLIGLVVAFEPTTIDFSSFLASGLYQFPDSVRDVLPLTIHPWEVVLLALAVRAALTPRDGLLPRAPLPPLAWGVPVIVALAYAWGLSQGGLSNLGYIEARGLITAGLAFAVAWRLMPFSERSLWRMLFASTTVLALISLSRYFLITRSNFLGDLAYAHESPAFLAVGFVGGGVAFLSCKGLWARAALLAYETLLVVAMMSTGRRAGTLVFVLATVALVALVVRHRRVMIPIALAAGLAFAAYLGVFWNSQYGALGQPARAIRSQFQPDPRDQSSDSYRRTETYDVIATIRQDRLLGVGLGKPFIVYVPLPELPWWPMQFYTPHNNMLWLWLKLGILGASIVLGMWLLTMATAIRVVREAPRGEIPRLAIIGGAAMVVGLAYMQVDQMLVDTRATLPFAVLMAGVLSLRAIPVAVREAEPEVAITAEAERRPKYFAGAVSASR
ncbi:MAG: O-antigen ligase family protein [Dehalococcoidia bacterium]